MAGPSSGAVAAGALAGGTVLLLISLIGTLTGALPGRANQYIRRQVDPDRFRRRVKVCYLLATGLIGYGVLYFALEK